MNSLTLLVCIVAVAVIPELISGGRENCEPDNGTCIQKSQKCPSGTKEDTDNAFKCPRRQKCCVPVAVDSSYTCTPIPGNRDCREDCEDKEVHDTQGICPTMLKPKCCVRECPPENCQDECDKTQTEANPVMICDSNKDQKCCVPKPPPEQPPLDTSAKSESLSAPDDPEVDPPAKTGALHSGGCFVMYTLTSKGASSGTNALFSFKFYRWMSWYWKSSPWQPENNPGDDREMGHWDLYGPYEQAIWCLPADWIYVTQTTRPWDAWQIKTIHMWDTCHHKLYVYDCGNCWVSTVLYPNGGTWIQRTAKYMKF